MADFLYGSGTLFFLFRLGWLLQGWLVLGFGRGISRRGGFLFLPEAEFSGKPRARGSVVFGDHRIVRGQPPFFAILLW